MITESRILLMFRADVPPEMEAEWNKWYDTKHLPSRLRLPGFISGRRFVTIEGEPKYLSIYDLTGVDVLTSEAYLKLRDSDASLPQDSFEAITMQQRLPNSSRSLYEQIYCEQGEYQVPDTKIILALGYEVPPAKEEEFNAWHNTECIPAMKHVPGIVTIRRFVAIKAELPSRSGARFTGPKYLTLCDLESKEVVQSDAFLSVWNSPWSRWISNWSNCQYRLVARCIFTKP